MVEFLESNIFFIYFIICFSILILIMSVVNSIYYNSLMVDNNGTKITKSAATGLFSFNIICGFFALVALIWSSYTLTLTYSTQDKLKNNNVEISSKNNSVDDTGRVVNTDSDFGYNIFDKKN